jgi:hypothetical protein
VAGLLIVLALGTLLSRIGSLSTDEAFTLHTTGSSLGFAWDEARGFEMQPPLYFLLLTIWRKAGGQLEYLRLFSTLCIGLSLLVLHRLSSLLQIGGRWWNLALLAALTPSVLWAAAEARVYALAFLLVSCMLLAAAQLWVERTGPAWRAGGWFVLAAFGAMMTQYYSGFVVAGICASRLLLRDRRGWWVWPALALAMLPWVPTILTQAHQHPLTPPPVDLSDLRYHLLDVVFRWTPLAVRSRGQLALVVLATTLLVLLLGRRREARSGDIGLVILGVVPVLCLTALKYSGKAQVEPRHWMAAVPGLLLLIGLGLGRLRADAPRTLLAAALFLFWGACTVSFVRSYDKPEWRLVGQQIRSRPGRQPVILRRIDGLALRYYLGPSHQLAGYDPYHGPPPDWAVHRIAPLDSLRREKLEPDIVASGGLWVVTRREVPSDSVTLDLRERGITDVTLTDSTRLRLFRVLYYSRK